MTIIETAKVTSKGQVTIPNYIRKMLHLKEGSSIAFGLDKSGVILLPCKITIESLYTSKEWQQIERLVSQKGKSYNSLKEAKEHIKAL